MTDWKGLQTWNAQWLDNTSARAIQPTTVWPWKLHVWQTHKTSQADTKSKAILSTGGRLFQEITKHIMHHALLTWQVPCELSWQPTKHGVCDNHCKNRSSKASPVSAKKTHKRLDTISEKLVIKSQVKLVIVQNLQRENCDKNLPAQTEICPKTRFEGKWKKISLQPLMPSDWCFTKFDISFPDTRERRKSSLLHNQPV